MVYFLIILKMATTVHEGEIRAGDAIEKSGFAQIT